MYINEIHHQGFCALVSHRQPLPLLADDYMNHHIYRHVKIKVVPKGSVLWREANCWYSTYRDVSVVILITEIDIVWYPPLCIEEEGSGDIRRVILCSVATFLLHCYFVIM